MNKLLEKRNTIYGFCAIWIVLFHTFRRIGMPYIPAITNVVGIGNLAVDVFVFFSGLCLSLSVEKYNYPQNGWGEYYKRRLKRVLVPYLIICIPYYLWEVLCESSEGALHKAVAFLADLFSASFWLKGTLTTWYVYGILVFYLLFPLLHKIIRKKKRNITVGLLIVQICFAVLTAYIPVLKNSMIVWARLPIFTIGIIAGANGQKDRKTDNKWILISVFILLFLGFVISVSEISDAFTIPKVCRYLLYIPMTLSLMYLLSMKKGKVQVLERIGGLSLEIYLIHVTLLHPIKYYGIMDAMRYWLYLVLPIVSIIIALIVKHIENLIGLTKKEQLFYES